MSKSGVNLFRPLLEGQRGNRRLAMRGIVLLVGFVFINLAIHAAAGIKARELRQESIALEKLIENEVASQAIFKAAAAVKADQRQMSRIGALESQVAGKAAFIADPSRFAPAQIKHWEGMLGAIERARLAEPRAMIVSFEAKGGGPGEPPRIEMKGVAPTKEAALAFIVEASSSVELSQLALFGVTIAPQSPSETSGWSFSFAAGRRE